MFSFRGRVGAVALALCGLATLANPVQAVPFSAGELKGNFDSTLSFGAMYRLYDPSADYYGISATYNGVPGLQNSVNADDGNLNYGRGLASALVKGSHDLEFKYRNFGGLVRGYWFYDFKADDTDRTKLSDLAKDRVVHGGQLLDMYVRTTFELQNSAPVELRVGRQVLSLGESTFIPNGLNIVNPADLSKLRTPGSEIKEALLPVNMIKASVGLTSNITVEPFVLLEFRRNELEPAGTFFSTNDVATRGGNTVWLGFGSIADRYSTIGGIPRDRDRDAQNYGQWGVAVRAMVPQIQDTEFGLYYARYSSRSPILSAFTPTAGISSALVQSTAVSIAQGTLAPALVNAGLPPTSVPGAVQTLLGAALTGVPASALPANLQPFYPAAATIAANAGKVGLLTAAGAARYFAEYPEDIYMYGASFNTSIGTTGISWQGEVGLKEDVPLQVDDVELLFAALSSLSPKFGASNQIGSYLGQYNREISGYRRHNVWTAQTTLTKVFGPMLGSQQFTLLGEVGGVWVNLPSKDVLRYDSSGTFTSGSQTAMDNTGFAQYAATPASAFADKFSWGYAVLGRLEYSGLLPNITTLPSVAFTHDVRGNTPLPLGNFLQDRKSVTVGVEFSYRNALSVELRYVNFFGAGKYNLMADRDFFTTTVKYSF